jgi:hypothetical protein
LASILFCLGWQTARVQGCSRWCEGTTRKGRGFLCWGETEFSYAVCQTNG